MFDYFSGGKKPKKEDGSDGSDCFEEDDEYDNGAEIGYISNDSSE